MQQFIVSDSSAYNRGFLGGKSTIIKGVQGVTCTQDYFPILETKRRASRDDTKCRLTNFSLAAKGSPRGVTAKLLITTKAPHLTQVGPPTMDVLFQDRTRIRMGYHRMPKIITTTTNTQKSKNHKASSSMPSGKEEGNLSSWMATSIHFDDDPRPRYRIQMTRTNFPFLVQIFDAKTNSICVSILTFGPTRNRPRIIHAFQGNIDTVNKAKENFYGTLFGILNEEEGILAFQDGLRNDYEKATFCAMFLMRTRLLTFDGEW